MNPHGRRFAATKTLMILGTGVAIVIFLQRAQTTLVTPAIGCFPKQEQDQWKEWFLTYRSKFFETRKGLEVDIQSPFNSNTERFQGRIDEATENIYAIDYSSWTRQDLYSTNDSHPEIDFMAGNNDLCESFMQDQLTPFEIQRSFTVEKEHNLNETEQTFAFVMLVLATGLILVFSISELVIKPIVESKCDLKEGRHQLRLSLVIRSKNGFELKIDVEEGDEEGTADQTYDHPLQEGLQLLIGESKGTKSSSLHDQISTVNVTIIPNEEPRAEFVQNVATDIEQQIPMSQPIPMGFDVSTIPIQLVEAEVVQLVEAEVIVDAVAYYP